MWAGSAQCSEQISETEHRQELMKEPHVISKAVVRKLEVLASCPHASIIVSNASVFQMRMRQTSQDFYVRTCNQNKMQEFNGGDDLRRVCRNTHGWRTKFGTVLPMLMAFI